MRRVWGREKIIPGERKNEEAQSSKGHRNIVSEWNGAAAERRKVDPRKEDADSSQERGSARRARWPAPGRNDAAA